MYKLTQPNGFDFYTGTINYRDNIGKIIRVTDYDPFEKGACGKGLHASKNPNDCFVGARIPCAAFRVKGIDKIAGDKQKTRYKAIKVIEEITDLNNLFGWNYNEAVNPIDPFKIKPPKITNTHIEKLKEWASVYASVGASVCASVGDSVYASVRGFVWDSVCASVGGFVGDSVWDSVCDSVWKAVCDSVRDSVWDSVCDSVRDSVWDSVGAYAGSLFPNIKTWRYISHAKEEYPFQPTVDLWRQGFVPSFDGTAWRLHGGEKVETLFEMDI